MEQTRKTEQEVPATTEKKPVTTPVFSIEELERRIAPTTPGRTAGWGC